MPLDWVPLEGYNQSIAGAGIGAGVQETFELMQAPDLTTEVLGKVEDGNQYYKILRIVGQYTVYSTSGNPPTAGEVFVRLWPGFWDLSFALATVPGGLDSALAANEKWWWERVIANNSIPGDDVWGDTGNTVTHPWHTFVDIKPKYTVRDNEVPCVTVLNNTNSNTVTLRHRWRMLVSHK